MGINHDSRLVWQQFTIRYITALSVVALLIISGHLLIQHILQQQMDDAQVINIAGRQRMLSQKIVKASLAITHAETEDTRAFYVNELATDLDEWHKSIQGLRSGDASMGLSGENSAAVEGGFIAIESSYEYIRETTQALLEEPSAGIGSETLAALLHHEARFLAGMNDIVFQYARESQRRVERLRSIEWTLLTVTLVTLLLEGLFVFMPFAIKVREAIEVAEANAVLTKANSELEKAVLQTQHASQMKNAYLANMSHEIRTPMSGVIGMADLLTETPLSKEQQECVDVIKVTGDNLLRIVNDILDFSKIEAGKLDLLSKPFEVRKAVQDVLSIISVLVDREQVRLSSTVDPSVPHIVQGDLTRIQQVLINLLSNAVKFTDEGEVTVGVSIASMQKDSCTLHFAVTDTGVGIPASRMASIFESFVHVDGSKTPKEGTGLGLAISKRLSEMMGGRIWVESEQGIGSTFHFTVITRLFEKASVG